jgi:hypothetical protein
LSGCGGQVATASIQRLLNVVEVRLAQALRRDCCRLIARGLGIAGNCDWLVRRLGDWQSWRLFLNGRRDDTSLRGGGH